MISPTLLKEFFGLLARYAAPAIVAALAHWMKETDQARLVEILTSEEMLAVYVTCAVSGFIGFKAWLKKTRFGLTAAASDRPATIAETAALSKTSAPLLSTPAHAIPQLNPKATNEPKE